ncbi:MAG: hypothetical protein ACIAQZ_06590 [Sedimentisphaeraceae bacterium JB056]
MRSKYFIVLLLATVLLLMPGCKRASEPTKANDKPEITKENLSSELDKMEQEIEADMASEQ